MIGISQVAAFAVASGAALSGIYDVQEAPVAEAEAPVAAETSTTTNASVEVSASVKPVVVGGPQPQVLAEGTEIQLRTLTELTSKRNRVGDRFDLEVAEDVQLDGRTVIPVGTRAVGEITKVTKKGMFGKSGKLEVRVLYVKLGDRQIRVRGANGDRGKGGTAGTVASLVFIWPAAFFVTGTSAVLPPGTTTTAYLESDLPVLFADAPPPTPVVIPASSNPGQ